MPNNYEPTSLALDKSMEGQLTDTDLDEILAAGAEVLRGLKLIPEGSTESLWPTLSERERKEYVKGNVLETIYQNLPADADRQDRLVALMCYCKG